MSQETVMTLVMAQDKGFSATMEKAQAVVNQTSAAITKRMETAARSERLLTKAMELEAAGQKKSADALRERIALMDQAAKMAAKTGITQAAAMDMVRRREQAGQSIASQTPAARRTGPVGLPPMALTPEYLRDMERATARTRELSRQAYAAGRGGMAGSMGFLAFSQAVEDSQYGIKGVLNNIPQMVLGFGGTMGLAGAISLAAVAAASLWPLLKKISGSAYGEQATAGFAAFSKAMDASRKKISESTLKRRLEEEKAFAIERNKQGIVSELGVQSPRLAMLDAEIERRKLIGAEVNETAAMEISRLKEAEELNRKAAAAASVEAQRIDRAGTSRIEQIRWEMQGVENQLDKELQLQAYADARIAQSKEQFEKGDRSKQNVEMLRRNEALLAEQVKRVGELENQYEILGKELADTTDIKKQSLNTINATIKARTDEAKALEVQITRQEKLNRLREQEAALARIREYADEQARRAAAFAEEQKQAEERVKARAGQRNALGEFGAEILSGRLRNTGRDAMATALEKEIALRQRAADIAEQTGRHEEHILRILRQSQREEERGPRAEIRRRQLGFGTSRLEGRGGFIGGTASLRNAEIERRARESERRAAQKKDPAAAYWERQIDLVEKLAGYVEKLGVI